jgi:hypothetical protein
MPSLGPEQGGPVAVGRRPAEQQTTHKRRVQPCEGACDERAVPLADHEVRPMFTRDGQQVGQLAGVQPGIDNLVRTGARGRLADAGAVVHADPGRRRDLARQRVPVGRRLGQVGHHHDCRRATSLAVQPHPNPARDDDPFVRRGGARRGARGAQPGGRDGAARRYGRRWVVQRGVGRSRCTRRLSRGRARRRSEPGWRVAAALLDHHYHQRQHNDDCDAAERDLSSRPPRGHRWCIGGAAGSLDRLCVPQVLPTLRAS